MIIEGYNTKDLTFIGFFDTCLFKHNDDSGGYIFEDKNGERHNFTYRQVKKAIKREKKENGKIESKT